MFSFTDFSDCLAKIVPAIMKNTNYVTSLLLDISVTFVATLVDFGKFGEIRETAKTTELPPWSTYENQTNMPFQPLN